MKLWLAALAFVVAGVGLDPAAASEPPELPQATEPAPEGTLPRDVIEAVVDETWLSLHLGLLDPEAFDLTAEVLALDRFPDLDASGYQERLDRIEHVAGPMVEEASTHGVRWPPALTGVLGRQGGELRNSRMFEQALREAQTISGVDLAMLDQPSGPAEPRRPGPPPTPPASTGSEWNGVLLSTLVVALVAALGLAFWAWRRSHRVVADPLAQRVMEVGRNLTAILDRDVVLASVESSVCELTGARQARVAAPDDTSQIVEQVVQTGAVVDQLVDGVRSVAVPCVGDGRVLGVIVAADPERADTLATLGGLAGFVGPALAAADRHGSVADIDDLTQTYNRRRLDRDLAVAVKRTGLLSMVMVDIDHFKSFNDDLGHAAGDAVLRAVARVLRTTVRTGDVVYRYGGEEFSILLPSTTSEEAYEVCERVRLAVENEVVVHDGITLPPVTISAGVATSDSGEVEGLARAADRALYGAKRSGRNRVLIAG